MVTLLDSVIDGSFTQGVVSIVTLVPSSSASVVVPQKSKVCLPSMFMCGSPQAR